MDFSCLNRPFEDLPFIDTNGTRFSARPPSTHYSPFSHNFLSSEASNQEVFSSSNHSFMSSTSSPSDWNSSSSTDLTSPVTPITIAPDVALAGREFNMMEDEYDIVDLGELPEDRGHTHHNMWMDAPCEDSLAPHLNHLPATPITRSVNFTDHPLYHSGDDNIFDSEHHLALSRSVLDTTYSSEYAMVSDSEALAWPTTVATTPPQTIAPSATFQNSMISSPVSYLEPSTPVRSQLYSSTYLGSSPVTPMISTPIVPSQQGVNGSLSDEEMDNIFSINELRRRRPGTDRLLRRSYERRRQSTLTAGQRPIDGRSGMNCSPRIKANEYACSYPDCVDRKGRPKRFKRAEHRKRHEKTVHQKEQHYKCWVPGCTTKAFSRTDNLKMHLRKTHGRKSINQRNRYVATLDETSEFYNPEWVGEITDEGYPIR